jgi:hypothetical protein
MQFQSTESWWPFLVPRPARSTLSDFWLSAAFSPHIFGQFGLRPDRIRCIAHDHHNFEESMYGHTTAIKNQSRARQAIRLVEISTFVENAPLKIEVIHFDSATYVWHSPCIYRYRRNVDSQIQQPMMSCQRSTTNGPVSSNPYYWRIHRDWRCLCRSLSFAGP